MKNFFYNMRFIIFIIPVVSCALVFYPPDARKSSYAFCQPERRLVSHSSHASHSLRHGNYKKEFQSGANISTIDDGVCPEKFGKCVKIDDEWRCKCHLDYYNFDENTTKACRNTVLPTISVMCLSLFTGMTPLPSYTMGWTGISLIIGFIDLLIFILLVVRYYCHSRKRFTPEASNPTSSSVAFLSTDNNRVIIIIIITLGFLFLFWGYTILLSIIKPVNSEGVESI